MIQMHVPCMHIQKSIEQVQILNLIALELNTVKDVRLCCSFHTDWPACKRAGIISAFFSQRLEAAMLISRAALQTVVLSMPRLWHWRYMRRTAVPSLRATFTEGHPLWNSPRR